MIEVVREADDRLTREVWEFSIGAPTSVGQPILLRLNSYEQQKRKTPRHKYQRANFYASWKCWIKRKDQPNPPQRVDVGEEALSKARALLRVDWNDD